MLEKLSTKFIRFIYPPSCSNCNNLVFNYNLLCINCFKKLKRPNNFLCNICGSEVDSFNNSICSLCKKNPPYFDSIKYSFVYNDFVSLLISKYKYEDATEISNLLGFFMLKTFLKNYSSYKIDAIIPMPIHYFKLIKRRYNQTCFLAKYISNYAKINYYTNILLKNKNTKAQASLKLKDRILNVKDSFKVNKNKINFIKNKNILLIEDIITTGNTINEASKVLKEAGAKKIYVLSFAKVEGFLKIYYNYIS